MAGQLGIDVSEMMQLAADLNRGPGKVATQLNRITQKTGADGEGIAKGNAPVDTGHLRSTISHRVQGSALQDGGVYAEWGPTADYGRHVEYGTWRQNAQPYTLPSLDAVTPGFVGACEQSTDAIL